MSKKSTKLNKVIFIIADTLRAKNVGIYGRNPSPTPNIDKLGKEGVVFLNAYSTITATDPSITSIMSGLYPLSVGLINHGFHVTPQEEDSLTNITFLSEIFRKNGYKTAAIDWMGRWHKRGYDYYSGRINKGKEKSYPIFDNLPFPLILRILDKIAIKYFKREFFIRFYYAFFPHPKIPYDPANLIVDRAIKVLKQNENNKLFLYLHFWDAHSPHTKPRGLKSYLLNNVNDTYNAEINYLDKEIGRLYDYLNSTQQLSETLIVFTADHGENLSEHDIAFNHENLYEDVVKVPLIIKSQNLPIVSVRSCIQLIDIFPTVLTLSGIKYDKNIDGKSLLPLISKQKNIGRILYYEDLTYRKLNIPQNTRRRGFKIGKYKYIITLTGNINEIRKISPRNEVINSKKELYDLKIDPNEKKNIYKNNKNLSKLIELKLDKFLANLNNNRIKKIKKRSTNKQNYSQKKQSLTYLKSLGY